MTRACLPRLSELAPVMTTTLSLFPSTNLRFLSRSTTKGEIAQHDMLALNDAMNSSQNTVQKKLNKLVDWSV